MKTINTVASLIPNGLIGSVSGLSQSVVQVVPGQFYSYTTVLTPETPIFNAMHCKANKARSLSEACLLQEYADLLFRFSEDGAIAMPIIEARDEGLLDCSASFVDFGRTSISEAAIGMRDFGTICSSKDRVGLFHSTRMANDSRACKTLTEEKVYAFCSYDGRHGLFIVTELTSDSAQIVACHSL